MVGKRKENENDLKYISNKLQKMDEKVKPKNTTNNEEIIGLNRNLEKKYLRITGETDPLTIRPEHVLQEAFPFVIEKYQENKDYEYIIDQLKSIRQDLTVQRIQNSFCVLVYETNARISLRNVRIFILII